MMPAAAATRRVLEKKLFLKFCNIQGKTPVLQSQKRDSDTGAFL